MRRGGAFVIVVSALAGCGADLPPVIRDEITMTAQVKKGAATLVFFTDFQCPHCRRTHAALAPLLYARRDRVRLVLRHVPLPRHPDARGAARAAICVERIARPLLDDYAHALFEAPDLSEAACETMAVDRGIDRDRFQQCLSDPATAARLDRDLAAFDAVKGDGVPLLYVGQTRLEGAQSAPALEAALEDALGR
jgi:protein-disulfide isomerase